MAAGHHSPLAQFEVNPIIRLPEIFGVDMSLTNSALFMLAAILIASVFFMVAMKKRQLVPSRLQSLGESIYLFTYRILEENVGPAGRKFFPFIFTLFLFILFNNVIGMIPFSFTPTSHIIVTFGLAITVFLMVIVAGIMKQGLVGFLKHFVPEGIPMLIAPLIVLIELLSFLARPLSLSIRLAANMMAGHTLMKVVAGFVLPMGIFGAVPLAFLGILTGFEIFIAILQAYVFTLLSCLYLGEALAEHAEHH